MWVPIQSCVCVCVCVYKVCQQNGGGWEGLRGEEGCMPANVVLSILFSLPSPLSAGA